MVVLVENMRQWFETVMLDVFGYSVPRNAVLTMYLIQQSYQT